MWKTIRYLATSTLLLWVSLAQAETPYEKIEVGSLIKSGIERGVFTKPIPLPDGEWLVVSKRSEDIEITYGNAQSRKLPRYFYTLKNTHVAESPIYGMVVWFNPDALDINWGNKKCENKNEKALVDDFGYNADSMLYVCAVSWSVSGYKDKVATAATSKNKWRQLNLAGLDAYVDEISDDTLEVNIWGNKYRGTALGFTFLIKRTSDFHTDAAYASYVKDWVHAAGQVIGETLANNTASFVLPAPFPPQ